MPRKTMLAVSIALGVGGAGLLAAGASQALPVAPPQIQLMSMDGGIQLAACHGPYCGHGHHYHGGGYHHHGDYGYGHYRHGGYRHWVYNSHYGHRYHYRHAGYGYYYGGWWYPRPYWDEPGPYVQPGINLCIGC